MTAFGPFLPGAAGEGPAEPACSRRTVVVLEPRGLEALQEILREHDKRLRRGGYGASGAPGDPTRLLLRLGPGHCADLVWASTAEAGAGAGGGHVLLASSPWYEMGPRESLAGILAGLDPLAPLPRLADAVAVAAGDGARPAAIVLVTAADAEDGSRLGREEVAAALAGAGIALHVWALGSDAGAPSPWAGESAETIDIDDWADVERAVDRLREVLEVTP